MAILLNDVQSEQIIDTRFCETAQLESSLQAPCLPAALSICQGPGGEARVVLFFKDPLVCSMRSYQEFVFLEDIACWN
jgi:hypothetical protein